MSSDNFSLKKVHTFALSTTAHQVIQADECALFISAWQKADRQDLPFLVLGEGSNVLFLDDFAGIVVLNKIKGITISETAENWLFHVGAGENWHAFVMHTLSKGIYGLENLALIPGCVGSAPIQNIGAYGLEFSQFCNYVDILDLTTQKVKRLSADDCQFGYRESIFKHRYAIGYVIVAVGIKLSKQWQPTLTYGELKQLNAETITAEEIACHVCHIRQKKLPDPKRIGNAGSFFKNPIITQQYAMALRESYPDIPTYPHSEFTVKLAAGWLIDQCGLRGMTLGQAAIHDNQALVIINNGEATAENIVDLAYYVRQCVAKKFGVWLEPEVRFIDSQGEVDPMVYLK